MKDIDAASIATGQAGAVSFAAKQLPENCWRFYVPDVVIFRETAHQLVTITPQPVPGFRAEIDDGFIPQCCGHRYAGWLPWFTHS
jgi:hypothetical protein